MSNIRILPENVANQIAAGEVIERPASIVRELIDNSIDAGADRINIRIENGGKKLIRISDNGMGMDRDDMLLSLERHSTSKITSIDDIFTIRSLGFRGEALPSICSISRMEIASRTAENTAGHRLKASGGKLISIDETGAAQGTSIAIRDIFFNTPARLKFLKGDRTETTHIIDTVSRIALPFKNIHFKLDDAEKNMLNIPASDNQINRFSALMGRDTASSLIDTNTEADGCSVSIYLAPPENSRNKADRIYIYVNNRNIRDKLILRSIMDGYGQRLMKGRYPQIIIFLDINPAMIDINVHPAKQEVRFQQGQIIYQTISSLVNRALKDQFTPFYDTQYTHEKTEYRQPSTNAGISEPSWIYRDNTVNEPAIAREVKPIQEPLIKESPRLIGQLRDTYLLFQDKDGLLMIDQHAAHERILYEKLKGSYRDFKMEIQPFLIPFKIETSMKDEAVLIENSGRLKDLGIDLEHFGRNTFLLRSAPAVLSDIDWTAFVSDLIPVLEKTHDPLTVDKPLDELLTIMACHGAIKANQRLSQGEILNLLESLDKLNLPTNCPHGRPVFKKLSYYDIEKMFKRVV